MPQPSAMLTDAFGALLVRGIGIALMFVSTAVTARFLGATEYGTFSSAMALAMLLAALAPLGTDRILSRNLSTITDHTDAGREAGLTLRCTLNVAGVMMPGVVAASLVGEYVFQKPQAAHVIRLAATMFIPLSLLYLRQWVAIPLTGTRSALVAEQTLLPLFFTAALLLTTLTFAKVTAITAAGIHVLSTTVILTASVHTGVLRQIYVVAFSTAFRTARTSAVKRMRQGLPFAVVSIGGVVSQTCMPLVIAVTCGLREAAFFALAMPYAAIPLIPLGIFNLSLIPRCARHYHSGDYPAANHCVRSAATTTFLMAGGISLIIWCGSPLLTVVLGNDFASVRHLLPALLLAAMVDSFTGPTVPVMQTMGMENFYTRALLTYLPVQFGLVCSAGMVAGLPGAALGYLLGRCLWNILIVTQIYRMRGLLMLPYPQSLLAIREHPPGINGSAVCFGDALPGSQVVTGKAQAA